MAVTSEILRSYRAPRKVMRRLLAAAERDDRPEARALAYLFLGCLIIFLSQLPSLVSFHAVSADAPPVEALVGVTFFSWMFVWPLLFYLLAAIVHLIARAFGGKGSFSRARVALFWTVLAVSPLMLLRGAVESVAGQGGALAVLDGAIALAFCALWAVSLIEAEAPSTV
ncbi:YIP1 family protein [Tropicimonas sp. IMCC34043]|uniref:YIP1 family protein n=1 Tax=Tropicimonas sp. IMCC34043 TaxID=2248760 RepID=UPI000E244FA8|nr:YIP1 family protein [Tropicimonas sp. IMCC34043]